MQNSRETRQLLTPDGRRATPLRSLSLILLSLACLAPPVSAQVRSTIIGPGATRYPIAVSPLRTVGAAPSLGAEFADRLVRDLELSGIFRVVPRETYIESQQSGTEAATILFENWSVLGAHGLVKGQLTMTGDDLLVEARLFDVGRRAQVSGRRYRGGVADLARIADRFADEVIAQISGERGPFDSRIAFLSTRGGRFKDLYVSSANGVDVQRLTRSQTLNLSPRWGPGQDSLVLTSYRDGAPDLFAVSYPGGKLAPLARLAGLNLAGGWSPDGRSLVATLERDGNSEIALLDRSGALQRQLTDHWAIDVSPTWAPDGRRIAFCSSRSGSPQIYVMNRDGSGVRRVTRQGSYNTSPSWSPKGDRIAYVSRGGGGFQVFVVEVDGGGVHQVTTSGSNEDPSWSPDGRYLVYSAKVRGRSRLMLSDLSGAHRVQLTDGEGDDTSPSWSGWLD
jgi:TolB protein